MTVRIDNDRFRARPKMEANMCKTMQRIYVPKVKVEIVIRFDPEDPLPRLEK